MAGFPAILPEHLKNLLGICTFFKFHNQLLHHKVHRGAFHTGGLLGSQFGLVGAVGTVYLDLVGLFQREWLLSIKQLSKRLIG